MAGLKSITYEESRTEHFKALMKKMERKIDYWQSGGRYSLKPGGELSRANFECCEAGMQYNFYKDALEALAAQPKWISVEDEQKPRHGKEYLCVCALPNDPKHEWDWIMVLRWYSHGSNGLVDRPHFTGEGVNGMYVTHWMPQPKLPKEEA